MSSEVGSRLSLLGDGAFGLDVEPGLAPLVEQWLPLLPPSVLHRSARRRALITVCTTTGSSPALPGPPTLRLGSVRVWIGGEVGHLAGSHGGHGCIDLKASCARLAVAPGDGAAGADLFAMLTVASALLLGRLGRALVHAAAVGPPEGGSWLFVGDTHAGKTTTTATLLDAGWRFVSDDHVVLAADPAGGLSVEGWPRHFHLDEGWGQGKPLRHRVAIDPHAVWGSQWTHSRQVSGLVLSRVDPERPTVIEPVASGAALAALVRQSPWLMADAARAASGLRLLEQAARLPSYALRLGLDTFANPEAMAARIGAVLTAEPHPAT